MPAVGDTMTLGEKQRLFARTVAQFILALGALSGRRWEVTIGEAFRTPEQQDIYVQTGKSKTKHSQHLVRLAVDLNLFVDGKYVSGETESDNVFLAMAGEMWEDHCVKAGIEPEWGGRFGVTPENYETTIGWDANHYGVK
jgi:hypothetical protein